MLWGFNERFKLSNRCAGGLDRIAQGLAGGAQCGGRAACARLIGFR
jgi:hypothetical protein